MPPAKSELARFKERLVDDGDDDDEVIWRPDLIVKGLPQDSPPFINSCQTNSFLTAFRFACFYDDDFLKNLKHKRQKPKQVEDALRVIGLHCREVEINASLIKMAWNTIAKVPEVNGVFNFSGKEAQRVFENLADMSEFGIRLRCSCQRSYDDDKWFRVLNKVTCSNRTQLDNWRNGNVKYPLFTKCSRCNAEYLHNLHIPETTWLLPVDVRQLRLRDVAGFPRLVTMVSKPTENPQDDVIVRWRLAYISAVQPIPSSRANHLVSLQFLFRDNSFARFFYESTDGAIHPDTPSEKPMSDDQLLNKKCNDAILKMPALPGKVLTRKPEFAVYFRLP